KLKQIATKAKRDTTSWQPVVVDMSQPHAEETLQQLLEREPIESIVDDYDEQYAELLVSRSAELYQTPYEDKLKVLDTELAQHHADSDAWRKGSWVYYPWSKTLVHVIAKDLFLELRTTRNRNLITADEQKRLGEFNVGCAGMSVGSNAALSVGITGISQQLKLADGAVINGSNLNRVLAGVSDIGLSKSLIIARKLYEMNPYLTISRFSTDITPENIADFFDTPWPLHAVVDEIDNLMVKVMLRIEARKRRLPVVMVTDLGDSAMLDVERYDLDENLPLFHGLVDGVEDLLTRPGDRREFLRYAMEIIGPENASVRVQESLMQIGRDIAVQPQLGGSAIMSGAVVAYALRKIALGEDIKSGRTIISLDDQLLEYVSTDAYHAEHAEKTAQIRQMLGLE
ncbi:MAG TPA: ThiF family adenylyltransferase, partial [Candidatus Saccharimonadales bacterium]